MKTYLISLCSKKNNDIRFFNLVKNQNELSFDKNGMLDVGGLEDSISRHLQEKSGLTNDITIVSISVVPTLEKEKSIEEVIEDKIGEFKKTINELRTYVSKNYKG